MMMGINQFSSGDYFYRNSIGNTFGTNQSGVSLLQVQSGADYTGILDIPIAPGNVHVWHGRSDPFGVVNGLSSRVELLFYRLIASAAIISGLNFFGSISGAIPSGTMFKVIGY